MNATEICRKLAIKHYGSTRFFDENKMLNALLNRGFNENIAIAAILAVQNS